MGLDHAKRLGQFRRDLAQDMQKGKGELAAVVVNGTVRPDEAVHAVSVFRLTLLQYQVSKMSAE